MIRAALIASAALLATACTQTGNMERSAATGAVIGGVAGAVIGNNVGDGDAASGALVGAAVGAAAGAYAGCVQDGRCGGNVNRRQHYDQRSGRYYFQDPRSGQYYYENGEAYP